MQTRRGVIAGIVGVIGVVAWQAVATSQQQEPPDDQLPRFAPGGQLLPPVGWEAWVMVGSSTGLSYAAARPPAAGAAPGMFHNVRSEEHTSELQSRLHLVCRLLLENKSCHAQLCVGTRHSLP